MVVLVLAVLPSAALANVFHIVRQGDTISSLSQEYYGDTKLTHLLRAVNRMPTEGDVSLAIGEPLLIPECTRRIVGENESWSDLAEAELGTADRAWFLAEVNNSDENTAPTKGQIVTVPYMMPWSLTDGLAATIVQFFPEHGQRQRIQTARMLIRLNPGLRPRGIAKGTRIVVPFGDVTILPQKLAELEKQSSARRSTEDQRQQQDANSQLERLPTLLAAGSYVELVRLAGQISAADLTEAQQVTLHRYLGQAFAALDRPDLAEQEFSELLELQPDFQFDQVTTSPAIIEILDRARTQSGSRSTKRPVNGR
jgi:DNA-binding TFAR19-related protein (PDSD5 family)